MITFFKNFSQWSKKDINIYIYIYIYIYDCLENPISHYCSFPNFNEVCQEDNICKSSFKYMVGKAEMRMTSNCVVRQVKNSRYR